MEEETFDGVVTFVHPHRSFAIVDHDTFLPANLLTPAVMKGSHVSGRKVAGPANERNAWRATALASRPPPAAAASRRDAAPPSTGTVKFVRKDKSGKLFGILSTPDPTLQDIYFFHGTAPLVAQLKHSDGVVESAGLLLDSGDELGGLKLTRTSKGDSQATSVRVTVATLAACGRSSRSDADTRLSSRLVAYLTDLRDALADETHRNGVLNCLCQADACTAVWDAVAKHVRGLELVVDVLHGLVDAITRVSGGYRRLGRAALQNVLRSAIAQPSPSPLEALMADASCCEHAIKLAQLAASAWVLVTAEKRVLFGLLHTLQTKDQSLVQTVLGPSVTLKLLGAMLPGSGALSGYEWHELPLQLLPSEMDGSLGALGGGAILHKVLRNGGAYIDFDACAH